LGKTKYLIIFILAGLTALYLLSVNFHFIGYFNDDAWYINAARYLAGEQNLYRELTTRPIGYPALMVPVVKLFPGQTYPLKLYSVMFFLLSIALIYYLLKDRLKKAELISVILLTGFSPLAVIFSGDIIAEIPFLFLTVLFLLVYRGLEDKLEADNISGVALLSFLLAVIFYVKTQGAILYISFLITLLYKGKRRCVLYSLFFYLLLILPLFIFLKKASLDKYIIERFFSTPSGFSALLKSFALNAVFYVKSFMVEVLFFEPLVKIRDHLALSPVFIPSLFVAILLFYFIFTDSKIKLDILKIYLPLYMLIHIIWVNVSIRYMIPVFPFFIMYFFVNLEKYGKYVYRTALAIALAGYLSADTKAVIKSVYKLNDPCLSAPQTYNWIRNTVKDKYIMCNFSSKTFFKTGKVSINYDIFSPGILYCKLLKSDIRYVCLLSSGQLQRSALEQAPEIYHKRINSVMKPGVFFEKVYANPVEDTVVWKVRDELNPGFLSAYGKYVIAMKKFTEGNIEGSIRELEAALNIFPWFPAAARELASMYMIKSRFQKAINTAASVLEKFPYEPYLNALMGRAQYESGNMEKAAVYWKRAYKSAKDLSYNNLASQLEGELTQIEAGIEKN